MKNYANPIRLLDLIPLSTRCMEHKICISVATIYTIYMYVHCKSFTYK